MTITEGTLTTVSLAGASVSGERWLKDPLTPSLNLKININMTSFDTTSPIDDGEFHALGRANSILVQDVPQGEEGTITLDGFQADFKALEALRATGHVLLLQLDNGDQWYMKMRNRKRRLQDTASSYMYIDADWVQMDVP